MRNRIRTLALTAVATATAMALGARHRQVRRVAPELRTPLLYVPVTLNRPLATLLPMMIERAAFPLPTPVPERVSIPGDEGHVDAFLYRPTGRVARGALLWIHGGGRVIGAAGQDHLLCQEAADAAGVVVLSTDYRLAPVHPFPAALDDCFAALRWLIDHAVELGVPPRAVAVGGASAGGGLAAEVAQRAHDEGLTLAHQVLVYPMLDDRTLEHGPHDRGHLVWTPASNRFAWTAYLGHPAGVDDDRPYAVAARRASLAGLPPAWIGVGDLDLFHDEDRRYAARLRDAGVSVDLHIEPGMFHGADSVGRLRDAPSMKRFRARAWHALGRALEGLDPAGPREGTHDVP